MQIRNLHLKSLSNNQNAHLWCILIVHVMTSFKQLEERKVLCLVLFQAGTEEVLVPKPRYMYDTFPFSLICSLQFYFYPLHSQNILNMCFVLT